MTSVGRGSSRSAVDGIADPHRRHNPLTDEWVLVSAGRTKRPWQGRQEGAPPETRPTFDPGCYLCPGNVRANGEHNPSYDATYVFTNDFAALRPDTSEDVRTDGLLRAEGQPGTCRVVCFSPRHDQTLALMDAADVRRVVDLWASQTTELGARYRWVQVFENRGEAMGASNPHPHGQIWAGNALPREAEREARTQRAYQAAHGEALLLAYAAHESGGPRVVVETDAWLVVVPFWATWPFEALLIPRVRARRLADLDDGLRDDLAGALRSLLARYDNLFQQSFPYSMGWHQAPFPPGGARDADDLDDGWQLHAHFYPPLLRATVRKFMVGYELLSESQRDITAEDAAARLRSVPAEHYASRTTTG